MPASGYDAKAELCTSAAVESPLQESCVSCVSAQIICQTFAAEGSNATLDPLMPHFHWMMHLFPTLEIDLRLIKETFLSVFL